MKHITRTLIFILVLTTLLVSACAGAAAPASSSAEKVQADLVEFTGVIEAINGTQWTINGQIVTVDPSVVRDGPFQVGDTVKLEAQVAQDGSVVVTRVETPSALAADSGNTNSADSGNTNSVDNGNSNSNSNLNSNSNSNDNSSTPGTTGGLVFDDSGNEAFGPVDSITADAVVIGGQTFALTNGSEFKGLIAAGDFVKVHFVLNADGTYTIVEIETWDPAAVSNGNSNSNSNDDNSNGNSNGNSNDDDDDDNSNGNSNDDDDDDDNGNDNGDDDDNDDNSNDDNSNGNSNG